MGVLLQTQKAVYTKLKSDAALTAMISDVYDFVPEGFFYPYITIGESSVKDNSGVGVRGYEVTLVINAYSVAAGRKEVLEILERIGEIFENQLLAVTGYQNLANNFSSLSTSRLSNGDINGKIGFKILLREGS